MNPHRAKLRSIYQAALKAVHGRACVHAWLQQQPPTVPFYVIAIGKAAAAMAAGTLDGAVERLLVITRRGYTDPKLDRDPRVRQLEAGHPLPDQGSLDAGQALLDFIASTPLSTPLLFLISGGASALVEVLPVGISLAELQRANNWLLASGLPIQAMNIVRRSLSEIKGGGLRAQLQGRSAQVLLMSDVPTDNPATIGSGLLYPPLSQGLETIGPLPLGLAALLNRAGRGECAALASPAIPHHIVARADDARLAAVQQAQQLGYGRTDCPIYNHAERIVGDIQVAAQQLATMMAERPPGLHIWSGETTVVLPERPGQGGRCQSLALALALIQGRKGSDNLSTSMDRPHQTGWLFLAAGSDGSDGNTEVAGALVDGGTLARLRAADCDPLQCLLDADAGRCLARSGDQLITGPTGTNVMDIMLGLRW